jgi:hypothetical protein
LTFLMPGNSMLNNGSFDMAENMGRAAGNFQAQSSKFRVFFICSLSTTLFLGF